MHAAAAAELWPSGPTRPLAQALPKQDVRPVALVKVPETHVAHADAADAPVAFEAVPSGQGVQDAAPASE